MAVGFTGRQVIQHTDIAERIGGALADEADDRILEGGGERAD